MSALDVTVFPIHADIFIYHVYTCMYVCTYVCMYVCMYACIRIYTLYLYIYTLLSTYICVYIYIHIHLHTYIDYIQASQNHCAYSCHRTELGSERWASGLVSLPRVLTVESMTVLQARKDAQGTYQVCQLWAGGMYCFLSANMGIISGLARSTEHPIGGFYIPLRYLRSLAI